jgi:hypothetical protein
MMLEYLIPEGISGCYDQEGNELMNKSKEGDKGGILLGLRSDITSRSYQCMTLMVSCSNDEDDLID